MNDVIYNPLEDYKNKYKKLDGDTISAYFDQLVVRSDIDIEKNRDTVKKYQLCREQIAKVSKKLNRYRVFRVLMIFSIFLLPFVFINITPEIRRLRTEISESEQNSRQLMSIAYEQMQPLMNLFSSEDSLNIISKVLVQLTFDSCLTAEKEADMKINYDFDETESSEESSVEILSGSYNGNPFLYENKLVHRMGTAVYTGQKTITWTEYYIDDDGYRCSRTRSQTLHASIKKPKPHYSTHIILNYGAQGASELCFSRQAAHLEQRSEKAIERILKRGEKRLKKKTDLAVENNQNFVNMSNTDFEVLFSALDRTDEIQFRTLFTPLAQTNLSDLILSKTGYGDDFDFYKRRRMNLIISDHSQHRPLCLQPDMYSSYSFDKIKENFIKLNAEYFKAIYFDFAPLWAIPAYQERPVHSLKPVPALSRHFSRREAEALANSADPVYLVDPKTRTSAIFKTHFVGASGDADEISVKAYSYDIIRRTDYVSVEGDDGYMHDVPVEWNEYIPLEAENNFYITQHPPVNQDVLASKHGLSIIKSL